MECTSIKFELFWRKISRKDGCKGVSETALHDRISFFGFRLHYFTINLKKFAFFFLNLFL